MLCRQQVEPDFARIRPSLVEFDQMPHWTALSLNGRGWPNLGNLLCPLFDFVGISENVGHAVFLTALRRRPLRKRQRERLPRDTSPCKVGHAEDAFRSQDLCIARPGAGSGDTTESECGSTWQSLPTSAKTLAVRPRRYSTLAHLGPALHVPMWLCSTANRVPHAAPLGRCSDTAAPPARRSGASRSTQRKKPIGRLAKAKRDLRHAQSTHSDRERPTQEFSHATLRPRS